MFKKESENLSSNKTQTIIGPAINVKGDFKGEGDVIVEGKLEGSLKTVGNLRVGKNALINANIKAKDASISGEVIGNISIKEHLNLNASAKIKGDINCASIAIEKGALFTGKCDMNTPDTSEPTSKENK